MSFIKGNNSGEDNPFFGKQHTEEYKAAASARMVGKYVGEDNPNYRGGPAEFTCTWCNGSFEIPRHRLLGQSGKFCSQQCYFKAVAAKSKSKTRSELDKDTSMALSTQINSYKSPAKTTKIRNLGYSREEFLLRMQTMFQEGMSFDNYGEVWHIDHILPRSLFTYESKKSKYFKQCWSLWNLRPLFKDTNLRKAGATTWLNNYTLLSFDNGTSGSLGVVKADGSRKLLHIPIFTDTSYTKEEKFITRVDTAELTKNITEQLIGVSRPHVLAVIERPMVNPRRFAATLSAIRALEATSIVLENLCIPYIFIDSKEWQAYFLNLDAEDLKAESLAVGKAFFTEIDFEGFKDADGIFIGEYFKEKIAALNSMRLAGVDV